MPHHVVALLDGLQFRNTDGELLRRLKDEDWLALLQFGDIAHLTLPLAGMDKAVIPDWVVSRLDQNVSDNALRIKNVKSAYGEFAGKLTNAKLDHLVVKGFAQYPDFVEREELRFQSDIDLFCPAGTASQACDVLADLGYIPNHTLDGFPSDHLPIMARNTGWAWRGNMYDPEMPPSIDLHFCLWNTDETRIAIKGIDEFWSRRKMTQSRGFSFSVLSVVDNLGFCALHILRDLLRGDWIIHHVYEVAWFLHHHAKDEEFWKHWMNTHDEDLRSLESIALWLAQDWFQCDISPTLQTEMLRVLPVPEAWLREFSSSPLNGMFRPNKDGMWLHICLLSSFRDKAAVMRNALMPTRIPAVNAPGQNTTKTRKVRRFWPEQPHIRYVFHVVARVFFHLRLLLPTLYKGVKFWRCRQRAKREAPPFASSLSSI